MAGPDAAITLFSRTALNLVVLSPERQVIRATSDQGPAEEWELQISVGFTGYNEAFYLTRSNETTITRPGKLRPHRDLLRGRDIERYKTNCDAYS